MRTPDVAARHDSSVTSHGPVLKFVLRHSPVPQWYKGVQHREMIPEIGLRKFCDKFIFRSVTSSYFLASEGLLVRLVINCGSLGAAVLIFNTIVD